MPNPFPPTVDFALYVRTDPEEMLVYWVRSASRSSIEHRVDLAAYDGNGECGCERFEFGLRPALERGEEGRRSLECRHIRDAKSVFARQMLRKLIVEAKRQRRIRTAEKRSAFKPPPRQTTQNTETKDRA